MKILRALLALLVFLAPLAAQEWGLCPSFHSPSSRAIVFADAMKRARELDPAGTRIFSDVELPPGRWLVEWRGTGRVALDGPAVETARAPGAAEYQVPRVSRALYVRWTGEVDDLRVWLPGAQDRIWWPPFVALLRYAEPEALRTLDWTLANEPERLWDGRRVPPAHQVDLANRVGCGLHYTIPVGMSEAELEALFWILDGLQGELTLEVGNELWNPGLWSWRWLDPQEGRLVDAAAREIDRVFAVSERTIPRARHFVGGHLANPWHLRTLLSLVTARVDACGPAVYVGPHPGTLPTTVDACLAACRTRLEAVRPLLREHAELAAARGAAFVIYETGESFPRGNPAVAAAQWSEGMGEVYRDLARVLAQEGVDRAHFYSLMTSQETVHPAPFGLFSSMSGPQPPKAHAAVDIMRR